MAWLTASCGINIALVAFNSWFVGFSPQGRYVLLMVVLLTAIAVTAPGSHARHAWWKAWPFLHGSLLAISAAWTVVVIHANPGVSGH